MTLYIFGDYGTHALTLHSPPIRDLRQCCHLLNNARAMSFLSHLYELSSLMQPVAPSGTLAARILVRNVH